MKLATQSRNSRFRTGGYMLSFFLLLLTTSNIYGQTTTSAPPGIPFQAFVRDLSGNIAQKREVIVITTILDGSPSGPVVLKEQFKATTDAEGVFSIILGQGILLGGSPGEISKIDWAKGVYYLNIQTAVPTTTAMPSNWDYTQSLKDMGTAQFWSVPYALSAGASPASAITGAKALNGDRFLKVNGGDSALLRAASLSLNTDSLNNYIGKGILKDTATNLRALIATKLNTSDTLAMLNPYLRKLDTASLSSRINTSKQAIIDTATNLRNSLKDSSLAVRNALVDTASNIRTALTDTAQNLRNQINERWSTKGNAATTAANFIGTTDAQPLTLKTNNTNALSITADQKIGIGTATPKSKLEINSGYPDSAGLRFTTLTAASKYTDSTTQKLLSVDSAGNVILAKLAADSSQLQKITQNSITGWRILGRDTAYYGNIGDGAIDLSYSDGKHTTTSGATGDNAVAMGYNTIASAALSTAMGGSTTASGWYSTAMGEHTTASANWATSMGRFTTASGATATAMGDSTKAKSYGELSIGRYNDTLQMASQTGYSAAADSSRLFTVGNGILGARKTAFVVQQDGNIGINTRRPNTKLEINSGTMGNAGLRFTTLTAASKYTDSTTQKLLSVDSAGNIILAKLAADSSQLQKITQNGSTGWRILGRNPANYGNIGSGAIDLSYSKGAYTTTGGATGDNAVAMGQNTTASGTSATAMGGYSTASGVAATAMGVFTTASGENATAMGEGTIASNWDAVAMGWNTTASGEESVAMGRNTTASGYAATAMGEGATAKGFGELSIGHYNDTLEMASQSNYYAAADSSHLFTVGNGTSSVLKTAFVIQQDGKVGINTRRPNTKLEINSGYPDSAGLRFTTLTAASKYTDSTTQKLLSVDSAGNVILAKLKTGGDSSQLQKITENGKIGYRILGRDTANYGDIGDGSIDLSYSNTPSTTMGATGNYSTAMGGLSTASGIVSTAMGGYSTASGVAATAMGYQTKAEGAVAMAMGYQTKAEGDYTTAMGYQTKAEGDYTTAMGSNTTASGIVSTAMGASTTASGTFSTAMGNATTASGKNATAMGEGAIAKGFGELSIGHYNDTLEMASQSNYDAAADSSRLFTVGNGTGGVLKTAFVIQQDGKVGINTRRPNTKLEINSGYPDSAGLRFTTLTAASKYTDSTTQKLLSVDSAGNVILTKLKTGGDSSQLQKIIENGNTGWRILGRDTANYGDIGDGSIDLSYSNTPSTTMGATGIYSTASGVLSTASGFVSTAMGVRTSASGFVSTAMGYQTKAAGDYTTAMGSNTNASGSGATAMGYGTNASRDYTTAMGYQSKAEGMVATAMGANTTASGNSATAIGANTTAKSFAETVVGSYNTDYNPTNTISFDPADRAFVVGVGTVVAAKDGLIVWKDGAVGIGLSTQPTEKLEVAGSVKIADGTQGNGKVLTSDANGKASWQTADNSQLQKIIENGNTGYRIFGRDAANYGNIGNQAVDLSYNTNTGNDTAGATGIYTVALGRNTSASGTAAIAMGVSTNASGETATAMGYNTTAGGSYSTATGYETIAKGWYSTAMGNKTRSEGSNSTAMGYNTTASGTFSTAMGASTTASGNNSMAMGADTKAEEYSSTAMGSKTIASGFAATAMGFFSTASGSTATAMGDHTTASGFVATAMGNKTTASGYAATAMGYNTTASGNYAAAMGYNTTASEFAATAMGQSTTASGAYATAMGYNTTASGNNSTAMGYATNASGAHATAMGQSTTASGAYSTAMGYNTNASGNNSTAMGYNTNAKSFGELSIGAYNDTLSAVNANAMALDSNRLFTVGNGTNGVLKTAFVIQQNGNVGINTRQPAATLDLTGSLKYTDGNQANGKVLTSDANGKASWQTPASGGTTLPNQSGNTGKVLTTDGTTVSWQTTANTLPTISLRFYIVVSGAAYPPSEDILVADQQHTLGQIVMTAIETRKPGGVVTLPCEGQLLPISSYTALYSLIGTTYGGNGTTNFALPDLRGKIVIGRN